MKSRNSDKKIIEQIKKDTETAMEDVTAFHQLTAFVAERHKLPEAVTLEDAVHRAALSLLKGMESEVKEFENNRTPVSNFKIAHAPEDFSELKEYLDENNAPQTINESVSACALRIIKKKHEDLVHIIEMYNKDQEILKVLKAERTYLDSWVETELKEMGMKIDTDEIKQAISSSKICVRVIAIVKTWKSLWKQAEATCQKSDKSIYIETRIKELADENEYLRNRNKELQDQKFSFESQAQTVLEEVNKIYEKFIKPKDVS